LVDKILNRPRSACLKVRQIFVGRGGFLRLLNPDDLNDGPEFRAEAMVAGGYL
jgi:hypothetical protein